MKIRLLPLILGAALAPAAALAASPAELRAFYQEFAGSAEAKLAASGVDLTGKVLKIEATLGQDGRLYFPRLKGSTGDPQTDVRVTNALKTVRVRQLPPLLGGRRVTLTLGERTTTQASVR